MNHAGVSWSMLIIAICQKVDGLKMKDMSAITLNVRLEKIIKEAENEKD